MDDTARDNIIFIEGKPVRIEGEKNLLAVIRKAGFDVPTFCYRADLSIYGACRMCVVEIEGRGVQSSCTVPPEPGMKVKINTKRTRAVRKIALELMLANHHRDCTTCLKSGDCDLQALANKMGIKKVRFESQTEQRPVDESNPSIVRDPNKCILCGACVRMCREIQGKSVIDFAHRGSNTIVTPAYEKKLNEVDCTFCGQCVAVCPTGALRVKSEVEKTWGYIFDQKDFVIAQVAPAVRVAIGEEFGLDEGKDQIGLIAAALRRIGFNKVYDTTFTADLTIVEEATEFINRVKNKGKLPLFTSCCPAWVALVEQKYPEYIEHLSSCKSPQQMFGTLAKKMISAEQGIKRENLKVVSIMPCTAKKAEASRPEFFENGDPDVDVVLTTQELARMIRDAGIDMDKLEPEPMDRPFGTGSGAGVIFGASGGVAEAALRTAHEFLTGKPAQELDVKEARGLKDIKELSLAIGDIKLRVAVCNTLEAAQRLIERIDNKEVSYDMIEVMACPGGCIGGAGQPYSVEKDWIKEKRMEGLYSSDKRSGVRSSHKNPEVVELYEKVLKSPASHEAHEMLHTSYKNRRRIQGHDICVLGPLADTAVTTEVKICVGTSCYLRGAYDFMDMLVTRIKENGLESAVRIKATFCFENCGKGPNVMIDGKLISNAVPEKAGQIFEEHILSKHKKGGK